MVLIVPKRDEFERASGWRLFKVLRRWLDGELNDAIIKDSGQQANVTCYTSHLLYCHVGRACPFAFA